VGGEGRREARSRGEIGADKKRGRGEWERTREQGWPEQNLSESESESESASRSESSMKDLYARTHEEGRTCGWRRSHGLVERGPLRIVGAMRTCNAIYHTCTLSHTTRNRAGQAQIVELFTSDSDIYDTYHDLNRISMIHTMMIYIITNRTGKGRLRLVGAIRDVVITAPFCAVF
jgi:hypothetical protein